MNQKLAIIVAAGLAAAMSSAANFPLGTYIYTGTVLDYRHEARTAKDALVIQAVATNGTVLASCKVTDPVETSGVNFVLEVPVSSKASARSAAVGDELNCVLLSASGATNVSTRPLPVVARANAITNLNVVSAKSTAFAEGDKSALVSDDYLAGIEPWMAAYGKTQYEPFADWDGDGVSNYDEYKAGTNPFDDSDRLRITAFSAPGRTATMLSFEYAGGHLYALDSTPTLTNATWRATSFRVDSADAPKQQTAYKEGNEYEDVGVMTLYLAPASDSPSMFYTVRPE